MKFINFSFLFLREHTSANALRKRRRTITRLDNDFEALVGTVGFGVVTRLDKPGNLLLTL